MRYKALNDQVYSDGDFSIVPIRMEDRYSIMKWRNEQIYHLRQDKPLTREDQDRYFEEIISKLFHQEKPEQILFSFLQSGNCIGYGGLVHINWHDLNAEISLVMNTKIEKTVFKENWVIFLRILETVAFDELLFKKIFTYAYDLRPELFEVLDDSGFSEEARLKSHVKIENRFIDVLIHSKISSSDFFSFKLASIRDVHLIYKWANDKAVRENAINTETILWEDHISWYKQKLSNSKSKLFIYYNKKIPIGQIRIDKTGGSWEIDYSICKNHRNKGYGIKIILNLLQIYNEYSFDAYVRPDNKGSCKIFEKIGFIKSSCETEEGVDLIKYCYRPHG